MQSINDLLQPLNGMVVARCFLDMSGFGLLFDEESGKQTAELRIGGRLLFAPAQAVASHSYSPAENPSNLGPLLTLLGKTVARAAASEAGSLRISFRDGSHVAIDPDDEFEAWELRGPGELMIVSPPGGAPPAVWDGSSDQTIDFRPR